MTGPKNEHKASKWLLSILAVCSMLGVVFSIGGITLAAYLNTLKIENKVKVDFSDLGQYFDGTIENITENNETVGHRYYIANATQLQNFQKLVALGIFGEHDEFYLRNSIDCSGVTINPIGTENLPFVSSFDGAGHTISGLNIESSAGRDVGLFGFTSITSTVKNLILDHPTITVKAKSGTAGETLSPIENQFLTLARTMPEILINPESSDNAIVVSNPASNENKVATITGFPPTIGGYPIAYSIVGEEYLSPTYDQNGNLTEVKGVATTRSAFDLFPSYIEAKVPYTIGDNFGYYVLERYQINVTGNGKVSASTATVGDNQDVSTGAFKTIHPTYDEHNTNVGFFIGHCDGAASYLGLESSQNNPGLIVIEGNARTIVGSTRTLIGKSRLDNPLDPTAGEDLTVIYDFAARANEENNWDSLQVVDQEAGYEDADQAYGSGYGYNSTEVSDFYQTGGERSPEKTSGSFWDNLIGSASIAFNNKPIAHDADFDRQEQNAETISGHIISQHQMTYSKFYPGTNSNYKGNGAKFKPVTSVWEAIEAVEESDPESGLDPVTYNFNGQVIDGGLGGTIAARPAKATSKGLFGGTTDYYYRLVRDITINNGFMVWSTNDILPLLDESEFYINFDITYVATGPNGEKIEGENGNYFQILYNFYNEDVIGESALNQNPWSTSFAQFLYWQDLSKPYNMDNTFISGSPYDDSKHPIKADGKLHKERIQLEISTDAGGFFGNFAQALLNWLTGNEQTQIYNIRYPVFALGYGKSGMKYYADLYTQKNNQQEQNRFMKWGSESNDYDYYNGANEDIQRYIFEADTSNADGFQTYNPSQVSNPNGYENKRNSDITETGSIWEGFKRYSSAYDNRERAYFNSYFEVDRGVKLYIKDFTATFTNREGNTASLINNVDYVNGGYTYENSLWSSWPVTTGTQVEINWDNNKGVANLEFYRTGNYVVATDGSEKTDGTSDILSNADGYAPAAINPNL